MPKGLLGVEISSRKIRYAFVEKTGGTFLVKNTGASTIAVDAPATGSFTKLIQDILAKENISPTDIYLTFSNDDIIVHQLTLPKMSSSELEVVLPMEIEKIRIFTNQEFEYLYCAYPQDEERSSVLFGAVLKRVLDFWVGELKTTDIHLSGVEIAPLNLINILSSLQKSKETQALIVLSDGFCQFIFFDKNVIKSFYVANIGLTDFFPEGSDTISNAILTKLSEELKRVLKSYLLTRRQEKINKFWLVWDSHAVANLDEHFTKVFDKEVEAVNIERFPHFKVKLADKSFSPINMLCCTPIIQDLLKIRSPFPLTHFLERFYIKGYAQKVAIVTMVLLGTVGLATGMLNYHLASKGKKVIQEGKKIASNIQRLKDDYAKVEEEKESYLQVLRGIEAQLDYLKKQRRISWPQIFSKISSQVPAGIFLNFLSFNDNRINLNGEALSLQLVSEFMERMGNSALFENEKFNSLTSAEMEGKKFFKFTMTANLKTTTDAE